MSHTRYLGVLLLCLGWLMASHAAESKTAALLRPNDVVGFVGGTDVSAAQFTGHLESLLAVAFPDVRFRNFGWEGDTVFAQPRDFGFPPLTNHLARAGVTVLFVQYGRTEALNGSRTVAEFKTALGKQLDQLARVTPRLVLVTPVPFEKAEEPLPDLSAKNEALRAHAEAIRQVASERQLPVIDLLAELSGRRKPRLTDNGLQISSMGHGAMALMFAKQAGFDGAFKLAQGVELNGGWTNPKLEQLRTVVIAKNQLWFDYWRPQNWAFLGGDRVTQPSSRDHRDPKVRWFPAEMEKFVPLIQAKEQEIERMAKEMK